MAHGRHSTTCWPSIGEVLTSFLALQSWKSCIWT
jgi:hypothetical protein